MNERDKQLDRALRRAQVALILLIIGQACTLVAAVLRLIYGDG